MRVANHGGVGITSIKRDAAARCDGLGHGPAIGMLKHASGIDLSNVPKKGHVHGETDDLGFNVVADPVHVNDLNATLLHLLGFDHRKLTYRVQGLDMRLTGIAGNVVKGVLT